jgi:hypothetical protein
VPIALGWPAAGTGDPRFPARLILTELLNDQMGVIRTRLAASYGVSAHLAAQVAGSSYQVSGQVDARRAGEALTAMRAEVARLRDGQISPEQFARVEWMVRHGLPLSGEAELSRRIAAATAADVRAVASEDLARDHEVVALSGTRATLQAAFAATGIADVTYLGR